jgi:hypothetical protein
MLRRLVIVAKACERLASLLHIVGLYPSLGYVGGKLKRIGAVEYLPGTIQWIESVIEVETETPRRVPVACGLQVIDILRSADLTAKPFVEEGTFAEYYIGLVLVDDPLDIGAIVGVMRRIPAEIVDVAITAKHPLEHLVAGEGPGIARARVRYPIDRAHSRTESCILYDPANLVSVLFEVPGYTLPNERLAPILDEYNSH